VRPRRGTPTAACAAFGSSLCCAPTPPRQRVPCVKVHGVFPSCQAFRASSPEFQLHGSSPGDSVGLVTRFKRDHNQWPRNFATLGLSRLEPSLARAYGAPREGPPIADWRWTRVTSHTSDCSFQREVVFLVNSRSHPFPAGGGPPPAVTPAEARRPPFSRTYGVNLPSSFRRLPPSTLVLAHQPTRGGFGTVLRPPGRRARARHFGGGAEQLFLGGAPPPASADGGRTASLLRG